MDNYVARIDRRDQWHPLVKAGHSTPLFMPISEENMKTINRLIQTAWNGPGDHRRSAVVIRATVTDNRRDAMNTRLAKLLPLLLAVLMLSACGGGGGGDSSAPPTTGGGGGTPVVGTTIFNGGTLDALKALSPSLEFDHLVIAGEISLPLPSTTTISANNLTITSAGGVGYDYSTCQYVAAPDITFSVANNVVIDGSLTLGGRFGTSVTEGATCNSCTGQNGGDIIITGDTIKITGKISNDGGGGASFRSVGLPSIPCSSGGSGELKLAAGTTMDFSGTSVSNRAGRNFEGTAGPSGTANVSAGGAFTMLNGAINSTGAMTFSAASTDIFGPITYGTLTETIGGQPDGTAPAVTVLSPLANAALTAGQTVNVQVQAPDAGMGLKNVRIKGLGYDKTHPTSDFVERTLTVPLTVADVPTPATLEVTGTDNKGNANTVTVTGLQIQLTPEAEPNDFLAQAQTLNQGGVIAGNIRNGDAGFVFSPVPAGLNPNKALQAKIEDFYKVVCCELVTNSSGVVTDRKISVSVDFSADAAGTPDIDVYLFNSTGTAVITSSIRDNVGLNSYTETIPGTGFAQTDMGQTFYIGIQAWNVPSATRYKIKH